MAAGFIARFFDTRAAASAKRAEFKKRYDDFLRESTPHLSGRTFDYGNFNYKDYRHAWRRAVILARFYQIKENKELGERYEKFALKVSEMYYLKAPDGPYGKPKLAIGDRVWKQMVEIELRRLLPEEFEKSRARPLACIYMGKCGASVYWPDCRSTGTTMGPA